MTPDDDEALARLRAALHTIANRTPISGGRLDEISVAASEKRSRPVVTIVSAAAAVAAIAAVSAVVVGAHSDASRAILPSSGGSDSLTPTPVASPIASAVPSAVRVARSRQPLRRWPRQPRAACRRTTTSSPRRPRLQVSPTCCPRRPPATCSTAHGARSRETSARTVSRGTSSTSRQAAPLATAPMPIQVTVTKVGGDSTERRFASARPVASTPITVNGIQGVRLQQGRCVHLHRLDERVARRSPSPARSATATLQSLVTVADSLVLLSPNDPRIVAPANCQVPPGSVCGSDSSDARADG